MTAIIWKIVAPALTALGSIWALSQACKIVSFIYLYFIRNSSLHRYKKTKNGTAAWALVTGATDGIGRACAHELAQNGFNVILHGRNQQKLEAEKQRLLQNYSETEVRLLTIDASKETAQPAVFQEAADSLRNINLKVLLNNVGGSSGMLSFQVLQDRPSEEVRAFIDVNARFPVEITKALLPQLLRNAPSLILNIGSSAADLGIPYLSVYSGAKAYNKSWSASLTNEMAAENVDVEVLHVNVSSVATDYVQRSTSIFVPSASQMAKGALQVVGCGRSSVYGHWGHALQAAPMHAMPTWLVQKSLIGIGRSERARDEELMKKR